MWYLIRDVIRRFWWLFALAVIILAAGIQEKDAAIGIVFVLLYAPFMLGLFDFISGSVRLHSTLPAGRKTIGRAAWICMVPLFPAICAVEWLILRLLTAAGYSTDMVAAPAFFAALTVCMGCIGAILMIESIPAPKRCRAGFAVQVWGTFLLVCCAPVLGLTAFFICRIGFQNVPLVMDGTSLLARAYNYLNQLAGPRERLFDGPNLMALGVAAACIAASFWTAPRLALLRVEQAQLQRGSGAVRKRGAAPVYPSRLRGFLDPWIVVALWILAWVVSIPVLILGAGVFAFIFSGLFQFPVPLVWPFILTTCAMAIWFGATVPWLTSLKCFRMLPVSHTKLTVIFMSFPLFSFVLMMAVLVLYFSALGSPGSILAYFSWMLVLLGATFVGCLVYFRWGGIPVVVFITGLIILFGTMFGDFLETVRSIGLLPALVMVSILGALSFGVIDRFVTSDCSVYRRMSMLSVQFASRHPNRW